jgi:hypothetical protein
MGCGCKGGGLIRTAPVAPTHKVNPIVQPVGKLIVQPKPAVAVAVTGNKETISIFKPITNKIDITKYAFIPHSVILIGKPGNAESLYIKNLLTKLYYATPHYRNLTFYEVDVSLITNKRYNIPTTVLFTNKIYKEISGLFDVKTALDDIIKKPTVF